MATPEQINEARRLYPQYAWMLDIPELAAIITQAADEQWDQGRITGALQATQWWKDRNAAARAYEELFHSDPASAQQQQRALATRMLQWARQNGFKITDEGAMYVAGLSLSHGETDAEWQANFTRELLQNQGQEATTITSRLRQLASEYAVPLSDVTMKQWEEQILTGMVDENTFRAYLQEQAKSLFPGLANAIDRGVTVRQYVQPYAEIAVQELGINPNDIDWRDPKWSVAIHRIDSKTGTSTAMSLSDWTRELRSNPVYGWDFTPKAQDQAAQLGQALLERLGRAA